jgi:collagen type VII alpha
LALNLNFNGLVNADGTGSITFTGTSDVFGPLSFTLSGVQNVLSNSAALSGTVTSTPGGGGGGAILNSFRSLLVSTEDGEDGLPGIKGDTGGTGAIGPTGPTGSAGQSALLAQDGEDGLDGIPGAAGLAGATGVPGSTGVAGIPWFDIVEDGLDGFPGQAGATGATGATGSVGSQLLYSNMTVPVGNTIASTAVETAFASTYTIPANSLIAGDVLDIWMRGVYSTALTPPTGRAKLKIGSTVVADTGTLSALVSVTNAPWWAHIQIIVHSIGATGALECQADVEFGTTATAALTTGVANTAAFTIDTTVNEAITSTFTWGTSSSSNTITLREMIVNRGTITPIGSGVNRNVTTITTSAGSNFTTTSASYVDLLQAAAGSTITVALTKNSATSSIYITGYANLSNTGLANSAIMLGVNDGTTDRDIAAARAISAQVCPVGGILKITGLAAGAYTFKLRIKTTASTITYFTSGTSGATIMAEEI